MPGTVIQTGKNKYRLYVSNGSDARGHPIRYTKTIIAKSELDAKRQLNEFYYTANDIAKQMGVTTQEIINQTSAWSRLGLIK